MQSAAPVVINELADFKTVVSVVIGVIAGVFASVVVNAALIEISLSAFFSLYYGSIFILIGVIILSRLEYHQFPDDPGFKQRKPYVRLFAILIIVSGVLSFVLEKNWFVGFNPLTKIPFYGIVGAAISFCFVFAAVDLLNYMAGVFQNEETSKSIVDTPYQLYSLVILSLLMGAIYGFIFGSMDIEDANKFTVKMLLLKEEGYCFYIGIILGAVGGIVNEFFRKNLGGYVFKKMEKDPFSEEI